jgi:hypothetical protein
MTIPCNSSLHDRIEKPFPCDSLQLVRASFLQLDLGTDDEIAYRSGYEDLTLPRRGHHPSSDMHGDAAHITAPPLHLSGMNPDPNLQADTPEVPPQGRRGSDRTSWTIERCKDA